MNTEQAKQLRLAADIIETGHPWEPWHVSNQEWSRAEPDDNAGWFALNPTRQIRLVLATPPDGRPLHNPDNLTAEQVGAGFRLALPDEKLDQNYEYWLASGGWKRGHGQGVASVLNPDASTRLPLSVPWPEAPKPFQLPPPPPGMRWHREDGWQEGDLPQGKRPLVLGEKLDIKEDEWKTKDSTWTKRLSHDGEYIQDGKTYAPHRTRRPLTFEHAVKSWTWHRPGDPMPCDGEMKVACVFVDHNVWDDGLLCAHEVNWGDDAGQGCIIGWRYADEKKTVPLGPEDVPPGSVFRPIGWSSMPNTHVNYEAVVTNGVRTIEVDWSPFCSEHGYLPWSELENDWQINRSIPLTGKWDPSAWEPCSKQI